MRVNTEICLLIVFFFNLPILLQDKKLRVLDPRSSSVVAVSVALNTSAVTYFSLLQVLKQCCCFLSFRSPHSLTGNERMEAPVYCFIFKHSQR